MSKFRKKPVIIEAWPINQLLHDATSAWNNLPSSIKEAYEKGAIIFYNNHMSVKTLEGVMTGTREDFLIQGVKGELYPCKSEIFHTTYDPVIS